MKSRFCLIRRSVWVSVDSSPNYRESAQGLRSCHSEHCNGELQERQPTMYRSLLQYEESGFDSPQEQEFFFYKQVVVPLPLGMENALPLL